MVTIWGYTSSETLENNKEVGREIKAVKQLFSALLFKSGIKAISTEIASVQENTTARISLYIDDKKVHEYDFSPEEAKFYSFGLEEIVYPKSKIEVVLEVITGLLEIPISSIGIGMGFQRTDQEYLPTNHLALGLFCPNDSNLLSH